MTNTVCGQKYIVDGQQRLTTITLISIALFHLAQSLKLEGHLLTTLRNSIQGTTEYGTTYWMGFKDRAEALDDLLNHNLAFARTPATPSEVNIYANYNLIYDLLAAKFTTAHRLQTFIAYLRNRIYLVEIEVDKNKDVAMVFEVINDRGIPLRPYEILKGKLLSQIDIADRNAYVDKWDAAIRMIESFGEPYIDEFFSFYFRSKYADGSDQWSPHLPQRLSRPAPLKRTNPSHHVRHSAARLPTFHPIIHPILVRIHEALQATVAVREKPATHRHADAAKNQKLVPDNQGRQHHERHAANRDGGTGGHAPDERLERRIKDGCEPKQEHGDTKPHNALQTGQLRAQLARRVLLSSAKLCLGSRLLMFGHGHRRADYHGRGIGDGRSARVGGHMRFHQPRTRRHGVSLGPHHFLILL